MDDVLLSWPLLLLLRTPARSAGIGVPVLLTSSCSEGSLRVHMPPAGLIACVHASFTHPRTSPGNGMHSQYSDAFTRAKPRRTTRWRRCWRGWRACWARCRSACCARAASHTASTRARAPSSSAPPARSESLSPSLSRHIHACGLTGCFLAGAMSGRCVMMALVCETGHA